METQIRCTRCGKEKPASDYARKNGGGKILVKTCKACIEQKSARRYALSVQTEKNLKAFERFGISFTPYQGGDSYFVEALLKFRIDKNSGALNLWYELQQIDAIIEQAAKDIADELQKALVDTEIYFGKF